MAERIEGSQNSNSVYVGEVHELPVGAMKLVAGIDRVDVLVLNLGGRYFAVTNVCTHKGAPLCEGEVRDDYIVCPWHKARFRVDNGRATWPATRGVRSYPVRVEGSSVYVDRKPLTQAK